MRKAVTLSIVALLILSLSVSIVDAQFFPDGYGSEPSAGDYGLYIDSINFGAMKPSTTKNFTVNVCFNEGSFVFTGIETNELNGVLTCPDLPVYMSSLSGGSGQITLNLAIPSDWTDWNWTGTLTFVGKDAFNQNIAISVPYFLEVTSNPSLSDQESRNNTFFTVLGVAVALCAVAGAVFIVKWRRSEC